MDFFDHLIIKINCIVVCMHSSQIFILSEAKEQGHEGFDLAIIHTQPFKRVINLKSFSNLAKPMMGEIILIYL